MKTKKGDFVEITFVGRLDDGQIFDLNDKEVAKKENLPTDHLHQTILCLGEGDVVPGLDAFLIDKELNKELETTIATEQAFGKKQPELLQMIPLKKFKEHNINPVPGLQLNIDNMRGVVKIVSGGRVTVDFNHPLAGKALQYKVTITRKVDALKEQVTSFIKQSFHLHELKAEEKDGVVTVTLDLPPQFQKAVEEQLKKRSPALKELKFLKP